MFDDKEIPASEAERYKDEWKEWGRRVAQAIRQMAKSQDIPPTTWLRKFGVPDSTASDMLTGTISEKYAWVYARLFVVEGVQEADPRTIPPRVRWARDKFILWERAWSDADLERWKKKNSAAVPPDAKAVVPPPLSQSEPSVQSAFEVILAQISKGTVDELMGRLQPYLDQLTEARMRGAKRTPAQVVGDTLRLFEKAIEEGGPIDRDKLVEEIGMSNLRDLFKFAGDFTQARGDREVAVRTNYRRKERPLP